MTVTVGLYNPKYPRNVGTAVRAMSCFGHDTLLVSGTRVPLERSAHKSYRLPREERMRGGRSVEVRPSERFRDDTPGLVPVAVELVPGAVSMPFFEHPEDALYVFGPEDGSLPAGVLSYCHHFVSIPMRHCANLASAVFMVLYDRHCKRVLSSVEDPLELREMSWREENEEAVA